MAALTLNLNSLVKPLQGRISNLSRSQFRQIANDNPEMKLERNQEGYLIIMAPTGGETGSFNFDSWIQTQAKMVEYMESGCRLGWLLDPKGKRAVIYRLGKPPELLTAPESLSGEDVLRGFVLDARFLWS